MVIHWIGDDQVSRRGRGQRGEVLRRGSGVKEGKGSGDNQGSVRGSIKERIWGQGGEGVREEKG